jgi:hypothetical protein
MAVRLIDEREGPRVPFGESVRVSGAGNDLECRGLDLSITGIGLELFGIAPWPLGATLELRFALPGEEPLVLVGWLVRRFEHLRHLERCRTQGVGIAFERPARETSEAIARYVEDRADRYPAAARPDALS